jgi:hypothetical protein
MGGDGEGLVDAAWDRPGGVMKCAALGTGGLEFKLTVQLEPGDVNVSPRLILKKNDRWVSVDLFRS